MIKADLWEGRIELVASYSDNSKIKQVPGRRFNSERRAWHLPLSWGSCVALRGVCGDDLVVGEGLKAWAAQERAGRVELALEAKTEERDLEFDPRLFPYQRVGAGFLLAAGSALLGDEMGVGKTLQALAAVDAAEAFPCLIVCPNTVKAVWAQHVRDWFPERTVEIVRGGAVQRRKVIQSGADFIVINWEALRTESRLAPYGSTALSEAEKKEKSLNAVGWKTVIADEAHRAKSPTSKQTRALWYVSKEAEHRYALTGTPIANKPDDLWSVMHFVAPEDYPVKSLWVERYCLLTWSPYGDLAVIGLRGDHRAEFDKVFLPRFLRRTKQEVLPQLPPYLRSTRLVTMEAKQAKQYASMRDEMRIILEDDTITSATVLARLTRLLQASCATLEKDELDNVILTKPSCKVDALLDLAEERDGAPTVVFAESRKLLELCSVELFKAKVDHAMVTGEVKEAQRAQNIARFQTGALPFLLVTLGAGGEGLTFTAADTAVFLQRSWSMIKNAQAEARIHRPGQDAASVQIIDVRTEDTVEERVMEKYGDKLDQLEELVHDKERLRDLLD